MVSIYTDKYKELVANALSELRNRTDISQLTPGAKARAFIEICMKELGNAYGAFSMEHIQTFVKYANGQNLDLIGEMLGLKRYEQDRNIVDSTAKVQKFFVESGTFGDINSASGFTIPADTLVYTRTLADNEEPIEYVVTEDVVCAAAASSAYASIQAVTFGAGSNIGGGSLVEHNFSLYTDYLNNSLKTTNLEGISYARERETDDNYRYRIVNATLSEEGANSIAIRMAAFEVPGVADVLLDQYSRGIGTGRVYIKSIAPPASELLLATVEDNISRIHAFGNLIEAKRPNLVGVEMTVTLNLYKALPVLEENDLKQRVRDGIHDYINSLDINEALEVDLLTNAIKRIDSNIRSIGIPSQPIDRLYIWKFSAAEDQRVRREALSGYTPRGIERVIIEYTALENNADPITVRV